MEGLIWSAGVLERPAWMHTGKLPPKHSRLLIIAGRGLPDRHPDPVARQRGSSAAKFPLSLPLHCLQRAKQSSRHHGSSSDSHKGPLARKMSLSRPCARLPSAGKNTATLQRLPRTPRSGSCSPFTALSHHQTSSLRLPSKPAYNPSTRRLDSYPYRLYATAVPETVDSTKNPVLFEYLTKRRTDHGGPTSPSPSTSTNMQKPPKQGSLAPNSIIYSAPSSPRQPQSLIIPTRAQ